MATELVIDFLISLNKCQKWNVREERKKKSISIAMFTSVQLHKRMRKRATGFLLPAQLPLSWQQVFLFFSPFKFFFPRPLSFVNRYFHQSTQGRARAPRRDLSSSLILICFSIRWSSRAAGRRSSPLPGRNFSLRHHHSGELTDKQLVWESFQQ